ncbi:MAG TPA: hypothetical protein VJQ83_02190, partial [Tepidiformaceae bacterium]|nr:hypothetical protein [Tepidiformaceae bacterium]
MAQMGAADRATAGPKDQLAALARISEIASAALKTVRMSQAQAAETSAVAQAINRSVSSVTATAVAAADQLEQV